MKKTFLTVALFVLAAWNGGFAQTYSYEVADKGWNESFGNHRAVIQVKEADEVVRLNFAWRRNDKTLGNARFLIVHEETGDTVQNISRSLVNDERCELAFGPVRVPGIYYFYYLPYRVQTAGGFCSGGYLKPEGKPDAAWLAKVNDGRRGGVAKVLKVQARDQFNSFYPMEVIATREECKRYAADERVPFYVFAEDRKLPIRMKSNVPQKWMDYLQGSVFQGEAAPNEYYTFQVGVWHPFKQINGVRYRASNLMCGEYCIPATAVTCFNLEGVDPYGKEFKKHIDVKAGDVQPLWFGVDVAQNQPEGVYTGSVVIADKEGNERAVPLEISVRGKALADRGDSEIWRHSRLRWLNSTMGLEDTPIAPYTALRRVDNRICGYGREVDVDVKSGLPSQISAWNTDMLAAPIRFVVETEAGVKCLQATPVVKEATDGHVAGEWKAEDDDLCICYKALMEFDGWMNYVYTVSAKKDVQVKDIRLEIPMKKEVGAYFLGMGLPGQDTPKSYDGKWDAPEKTLDHLGGSIPVSKEQHWLWPFDSFWMGNQHAGLHCEFRGSSYSGPLLNLYRPAYPESWHNQGKGGFWIRQKEHAVVAAAYSGARSLKAGDKLDFDFAMLITPVKKLDTRSQFVNRYYHNGAAPRPTDEEIKTGVRIVNVHHATQPNPYINYPFLVPEQTKAFVDDLHAKDCKVKLYYTLRELTCAVPELWAIRSLGTEIFRGGNGGGYSWLREHLVSDYTPQWYQYFGEKDPNGISADASILTSGSDSRWYNYYIEGLAWMVRNLDIDGLYLDDVSYDRRILKRMRRAMQQVKPNCIIDLHSNTGFSKGPANQYAEFLPYVDKIWFGESFLYDKMTPANWLVESSGIPFGLTGDMLFRGGNRWLGMQYGMTVRYPWFTEGVNCDPRPVWKVWDEFHIEDAEMLGFWEEHPAVVASHPDVKVTAYRHKDGVLLSVGNYSDRTRYVTLKFDWKQLGIKAGGKRLVAPEIKDMQTGKVWNLGDRISVLPRKGWLIYVK